MRQSVIWIISRVLSLTLLPIVWIIGCAIFYIGHLPEAIHKLEFELNQWADKLFKA